MSEKAARSDKPDEMREQAHGTLKHTQHLVGRILDSAPIVLYIYDLVERHYVYSNREIASVLGYTPKQIGALGSALFPTLLHPDDAPLVEQHHARLAVVGDDEVLECEYRMKDAKGQWRWLKSRDVPFARDRQGHCHQILGSAEDITDRKGTEQRLRESEARYRDMFEANPHPMWVFDAETLRFLAVNDAAVALYGYSRDEFLSSTIEAIRPAEDLSHMHEALDRARGNPGVDQTWARHRKRDGTLINVEIASHPLEFGGRRTRLILVHDITRRVQAEAERQHSYNLLAKLAAQVPGVIYQYRLCLDGRSFFPYSSPGMEDIYEVSPEDVREDATPVFGRLHPDDYDYIVASIQESARTLQPYHSEFRVVLPRQGLRWRLCHAIPERMEDGGALWHGIISDITDRKRAEAEKAALQDQLAQAQKMESVGRLAGGVAHDSNNMLAVIMGHTELALEQVDPNQPLYANLEEIRAAAERSAALTRQLLAFARKQTIAPRVLDLNETVSGMLKMLRRLIGENIDLTWKPASTLGHVKMDPSQIDQILANLSVNARDAISGVGKVTIETADEEFDDAYCASHQGFVPGAYLMLAVSDTGRGMDRETLAHVFEPFFTTKGVGEGTGLGLATVYGIVKQNNGFIDARSEPGLGTTFAIYLPRHAGKAATAATEGPTEAEMGGRETILLVEDEPALLKLGKTMLERWGYTVLAATTPTEAIRLAEQHAGSIHLLVTDVVMPEMNGRDLAEHLLTRYPTLTRLFTSGYTADIIARHGVLDEGVHFIQKPFSAGALAAKVREAFKART
ncbi:MAG: PAS domain S-box protein [Acidobacteria bacterium]|nr:PAS domain S-box protein [Acidobacteriota bacterium]